MSKNIWTVTPVTSLTDNDYFYVGIYDETTPTLNKILKTNAFSDIYDAIDDVQDAIPTKVSDLTNDSGFLTSHQSLANYVQRSELSEYAASDDVPTKLSDLTDDIGCLTSDDLTGYVQTSDLSDAIQAISITTDDTLMMEGVPADAKAVGEAIESIEISLDTDGAGQPVPITDSSEMDDTSVMYLYLGEEVDYEYGHIYCYLNEDWVASMNPYGTVRVQGAVFSQTAITLLETILSAATFDTDQSNNIAALIDELESVLE